MKKFGSFFILAAWAIIPAALTSCENPLVAALLRGPAELDNIIVNAVDISGNSAELNYGLQPVFSPQHKEYSTLVPRDAETITIKGISYKGADVSYKMTAGSAEYINDDGVFYGSQFAEKSFHVELTVNMEDRDTSVYKLTLQRMLPAWITNIELTSDSGGEHSHPFAPGYTSAITEYSVGVNHTALNFSIKSTRRAQFPDDNEIDISYSAEDGTPIDKTDAEKSAAIDFPLDMKEKIIRVTASFPRENPEPVIYTLKVHRPSKVTARTGIVNRDENCFIISGAEKEYFFQLGEPVTFTVTPPFGYTAAKVSAVSADRELTLFPTGNTYSFIMPGSDVVLKGDWDEVPKADGVRYVWEHGTGDGSQWCRASEDLQKLIDDFDPVSNNYEIWIAAGTLNPVWSWVSEGQPPAWAAAVDTEQKNSWGQHCFVLKNGVKIYGGFAGTEYTAEHKNARDIDANKTILSGYKDGEGYTRHLMAAVNIDQPTLVEGLTLTKSEAGGRVNNIIISGKELDQWEGAGLYTIHCNDKLVFQKVRIENNFTMRGAGVSNVDSSPVFRQCVFTGNSAYEEGGALYNSENSAPYIENCQITGNQAGSFGGGIYHTGSGRMTVVNTLITNNYAPEQAAGIYANGPVTLINVSIIKNPGQHDIIASSTSSIIKNTIAWGGGANSVVNSSADISHSIIQGKSGITANSNLGLDGNYVPIAAPCKNGGDYQAYADAGNNFPDTDLAGKPRHPNNEISIGAFQ